jgi:tetratricopeptide (TPR) repeat protein
MTGRRQSTKIMVAGAVVFLCAAAGLNRELTRFAEVSPELQPRTLHAPMGGLEPVVADILWMRCIQFMGSDQDLSERQRTMETYRKFDRITRLDPKFHLAYRFGVLNLLVRAPERALTLVDRGLRCMAPEEYDWRLPFYGAFICYQYLDAEGRYDRSLQYLRYAYADAPGFVHRFQPLVLERQAELEQALDQWMRLYEESNSTMDHRIIRHHLIRVARQIARRDVSDQLTARAVSIMRRLGASEAEEDDSEEDRPQ